MWKWNVKEIWQTVSKANKASLQRVSSKVIASGIVSMYNTVYTDYRLAEVTPSDHQGPYSRLKMFLDVCFHI